MNEETLAKFAPWAVIGVLLSLGIYGLAQVSFSYEQNASAYEQGLLPGEQWVVVEDLSTVEGLWVTQDGFVQVSLFDLSQTPQFMDKLPWRLTMRFVAVPVELSCGLYETLHEMPSDGEVEAWRLAFCRDIGVPIPDPAFAERVALWRSARGLRLQIGQRTRIELVTFNH